MRVVLRCCCISFFGENKFNKGFSGDLLRVCRGWFCDEFPKTINVSMRSHCFLCGAAIVPAVFILSDVNAMKELKRYCRRYDVGIFKDKKTMPEKLLKTKKLSELKSSCREVRRRSEDVSGFLLTATGEFQIILIGEAPGERGYERDSLWEERKLLNEF